MQISYYSCANDIRIYICWETNGLQKWSAGYHVLLNIEICHSTCWTVVEQNGTIFRSTTGNLLKDVNKSFSNMVSCDQVERSNMAAVCKNEARAKSAVVAQRSWMRIHLAATTFQQVALSFNICCSTNVEPFIIDLSFFLLASGTFLLNTSRSREEAYLFHLTWNPQRGYTISVKCMSRYLRLIISTVSTPFSMFLSSIRARR